MEKAIVMTSFGTSVPQARASITAVEEALACTAPGYSCVRAFTSPTIRRILASRGETVPSLTEALEQLSAAGVRQAVVQPTHLLYGYEYDKLKAEADAFTSRFEKVVVGRPLLADTGDILRFADGLSRTHPKREGEAVVLMGHGTEHFANVVYPALQTALHRKGRDDLYIGTVEGWPCLDDVLEQLTERHVLLAPLMLVAGDHAKKDMAGDSPDSWKSRLERAGFFVSCSFAGLGTFPWVQEMYRERLLDALRA